MVTVSKPRIIVDTGPLVAFLVEHDRYHPWADSLFHELPVPFVTCEAVLTETYFLISKLPDAPGRFFEFLSSGLIEIGVSILGEKTSLANLMRKYRDVPMSLADACIVRLSELHPEAQVFTIDSDFRLYRSHGRRQIPLIIP